MAHLAELIQELENAVARVEAGKRHEDACITLVAPSIRGLGIRPEMVSMKENGEKIYLLNVRQARKLLATCKEAIR